MRTWRTVAAFAAAVLVVTVLGFTVAAPPGLLSVARDVTVAPDGEILVIDVGNRVIQKYSPSGQSLGALGPNFGGGVGLGGDGVAVLTNGDVAAGADLHEVAVLSPKGRLLRVLGNTGPDRLAAAERFAPGPNGTVYVPDTGHCRIDVYGTSPAPLRTFGRCGHGHGSTADPAAVAIRGDQVYVADGATGIVVFSLAGRWLRTIATPTARSGSGGIAVAPSGAILLCVAHNQVAKLSANGRLIGMLRAPGMHSPDGVAVGRSGDIYVSSYANRIRVFDASGRLLGALGGVLRRHQPPAPQLLGQ